MMQYTVTQWVFFFYFYCFFGWCFESAYVSIKTRRLTNRGFMRGPFLPLYGSGAIMMLVVSMPFRENLVLTFLAGCVGATVLEYVTGVVMEALFKVRYWDYSNQKFQFQGRICLKSTLAWGGLTILMTSVVHAYVERVVLSVPGQILTAVTFLLTAWIFADFALSFKAAMDLRDVLVKLEEAKAELGRLQKRMDVIVALTADDLEQKVKEYKEILGSGELEPGVIREKLQEHFAAKKAELARRREEMAGSLEARLKKIFLANPTAMSVRYRETVEELRRRIGGDRS